MSIRTITEAEANNLVIPATDDLLSGFLGPVLVLQDDKPWVYAGRRRGEHYIAPPTWDQHDIVCGDDGLRIDNVRLPLSHPEVQAHLVGWLGRGAWCPPCGGGGFEGLVETPTRYGCPACGGSATKRGTGYLRPPADLYHLLKPQALGGLPDWIRLAMIWGSVVRVAAGMGPVSTIWTPIYGDKNPTRRWFRNYAGGPFQETSFAYNDTERAARDSRLIRAGCTLVDDTPTGRVIRFEVPDAP